MVKIEIDMVKPNLHVRHYGTEAEVNLRLIYSLENPKDVVKSVREVNNVVKEYISEKGLMVLENEFNFSRDGGKHIDSGTYSIPLDKHLDIFNKLEIFNSLSSTSKSLFKIRHIVDAGSYEDYDEIDIWARLKRDLAEPDKTFDEWEKDKTLKYDRAKSLDIMKGLFEKLDVKIPNQTAGLELFPVDYRERQVFFVGYIVLNRLRAEGREKVDAAKSELIERLKGFDGPCLSLDASNLFQQRNRLANDAEELVNNYGDILLNQNWQERFFVFDP